MQASSIKLTPSKTVTENKQLKIQNYDIGNAYPQLVMTVAGGSPTTASCLRIYKRFLVGKGIGEMGMMFVGDERLSSVFRKAAHDYATFGGFSLHLQYNALGQISAISHVPFENCRLGLENEEGEVEKVAVNMDWLGDKTRPTASNTIYCDVFDPDSMKAYIDSGQPLSEHNGQILYATMEGRNEYPECVFSSVLTDGATQVACSNIKYRNAKLGFLPFGAMVIRSNDEETRKKTEEAMKSLQGDVNSGKIMLITLKPGDEEPKMLTLDGEHYDGAFNSTEESTKQNIGEVFMQPPVLRCEQTASGFAEDIMQQAYDFYNSVTEDDRHFLEEEFREVLSLFTEPLDVESFVIEPLEYKNASNGKTTVIEGRIL